MPTITLKSSNGWPASKDAAEIGIKSYPIPGTSIKIRLAEKVAPLLIALAADWHKLVEPIDAGTLDSWGYAFRPIRGQTETLSNHSSGTAIDFSANAHPLGQADTFTPEEVGPPAVPGPPIVTVKATPLVTAKLAFVKYPPAPPPPAAID